MVLLVHFLMSTLSCGKRGDSGNKGIEIGSESSSFRFETCPSVSPSSSFSSFAAGLDRRQTQKVVEKGRGDLRWIILGSEVQSSQATKRGGHDDGRQKEEGEEDHLCEVH